MRFSRRAGFSCTVFAAGLILAGLWRGSFQSESVDRLLSEAETAMDSDDVARAVAYLDQILAENPQHGKALLYRGEIAMNAGNLAAAIAFWQQVPDTPADWAAAARFLSGMNLLKAGEARRGEADLRKATQILPSYLPPHGFLLQLYVAQMRADDARRELREIRQIRPWTLNELALYTMAGERISSPEEGIEIMSRFLAHDPGDHASRLALARYQLDGGRYGDAAEMLRELAHTHGENGRIAGMLAEALFCRQDWEGSHRVLENHRPDAAAPPVLWKSYGRYAAQFGAWKLAAVSFQHTLQSDPNDRESAYQLALALKRLNRTEEARWQFERSESLEQINEHCVRILSGEAEDDASRFKRLMDVALHLTRLGRDAEAADWRSRARRLLPGKPTGQAGIPRSIARDHDPARCRTKPRPEAIGSPTPSTTLASIDLRLPPPQTPSIETLAPGATPPTSHLEDVRRAAGLDFQYQNGAAGMKYLVESMGGGVAVLDYNGDGLMDLYFPQGGPLSSAQGAAIASDQLFRNGGDGTFENVTVPAGIDERRYGQGCAAGDYDNDGDADLFVANYGPNTFYRNNGDGTFTEISLDCGLRGEHWSTSAALADLDRDGNLDLYVANYAKGLRTCHTADGRPVTCSPREFPAVQDRLWRNQGDGTYADVTESAGIVDTDGRGLGVQVADFDDDGRLDIYVANDETPNFLFRNVSSAKGKLRFVEIGLPAGAALSGAGSAQAGMGIACADFDGNGRSDLFVTNFLRESNTLYLNRGGGLFFDATRTAALAGPSLAQLGFGTQAADFDLDGDQDLFVANGHIDDLRFRGEPWKMPPQIFENRGQARFQDQSHNSGHYFQGEYLGRGVARLDWDNDGRPDLVVVHQDRPVALLHNQSTSTGNSVTLRLCGVRSNRDGIGAKIRVHCGQRVQVVQVCGGDGFLASNDKRQTIGIGDREQIDKLTVEWPSGQQSVATKIPAQALLTLIEGHSSSVTTQFEWKGN